MTTGNEYRPPVLMIRMKGHELSEKYAEISRKTWEDQGYTVTYFDATTPETMHEFEDPQIRFAPKLLLRPEEEKRQAEQEAKGFKFDGIFSETEKAVWMSHVRAWRHVAYVTKEPTIICEHDALLQRTDWNCEHHDFYMMTPNILGAGFYHPQLLKRFLARLQKTGEIVARMNPDAYVYDYINKYLLGERGKKIRTKTHYLRKFNSVRATEWPVNAKKWAESTIEHRLFYDEENDEIIQWRVARK